MSKKTKVVVAVTNDLVHDQRMQRTSKALAEAGYHVTLVGRELEESQVIVGTQYHMHRFKLKYRAGPLFYGEYNAHLYWYLLQEKPDVILSVDSDTLGACALAKRNLVLRGRNCKLVHDANEYFAEVPEVVERPLIQTSWHILADRALLEVDAAYTVGEALAQALQEEYGISFGSIRNVPHRKEAAEGEGVYILYQGALNEGRGLELLIDIADDLPLPVMIIGSGDIEAALKERGAKKKNVTFLGKLRPEELHRYTTQAWLGYNVLENRGKSYYYSLSNKFFDYMQALVPSINSNFPEYAEIVRVDEVGLLTEPTSESVRHAILTLYDQPELYKKLQKACVKAKEHFNWEQEKKKLISLFYGITSP